MTRTLVAVILGALALSGCLSGAEPKTDDTPPPPPKAAATGQPVTVQDAHQNILNASAFPGELPAFNTTTPSQRISGEPTIGVTRTGAIFYPAIEFDGPNGLPLTHFMRSKDDGKTWTKKSPNVAGVDTHPYSFDPYLYVDRTTGRVFALDMGPNFNCNHISFSDDDGEIWVTQYFTCPVPIVDHPSVFAGPSPNPAGLPYPNLLYLCTNGLFFAHCTVSADGGATWIESTPVFTSCGGLTGHGHASFADGTVYLPRVGCNQAQVGISRDGGLTWNTVNVGAGVGHEAIVATDTKGTAYMVWIGDANKAIYLSVSKDKGASWSKAINITKPGVTAVKLPSITAGADGRIAFLYVGTETPHGWAVDATGDDGKLLYPHEFLAATWNAYIGVSLNADSDEPIFATTTAHPLEEPVKRGACRGRCFGDKGGMYDFLDIDIDPRNGRIWAALVDVCTGPCDQPGANAETTQNTWGMVGMQTGGTYLLDQAIPARR
jgi:hypothetical protein